MSNMRSNRVVRVWEVVDAGDNARRAYERVLALPTTLEVAKNVICLLLWLETLAGVKVLEQVAAMESGDAKLPQAVAEADAVYGHVLLGQPEPAGGIPTIAALCGRGRLVDLRFFRFHRDIVARGLTVVRDTVVRAVLDEHLLAMLRRYEDEAEAAAAAATARPVPPPELLAPAFAPATRTPPEDSCTAFVAFAQGHVLSAKDIIDYFEQRLCFGRCIGRVDTEPAREGQVPRHAVIVFLSAEQRRQAMFNENAAFFRINGNDIWVQIYKPPC